MAAKKSTKERSTPKTGNSGKSGASARVPEPEVTAALALEHGLTEDELARVQETLGRMPTYTELGVVSVMWSEHCSYKSSRVHLSKFPTEGPRVLQGPGENAGAIDIGGGWAAVFKMESHNHPSFIEPYQGAATGVGGILRDVFTMGARPVASLNSLRFGAPNHNKTRYLVGGVVAGIAGYGNCMGVPTVGGEVVFDDCYNGNILVNVFNLGVCRHGEIFRAYASGVGNPVLYVGAKTGRDGIHGATMASAEFDTEAEAKRPTVQVGDPFSEKLLLEAVQELLRTGAVVGIQDMGAAGLTSSSVEMASRAGNGIELDVDAVPRREPGMTAYECLLSESQERMLVVAEVGREADVFRVFEKWGLDCAVVGVVTDTGHFVVKQDGEVVCDLPVGLVTDDAPKYRRPYERPAYQDRLIGVDADDLPNNLEQAILALVGSPNLCSRRAIYEQFDHMVGAGTVALPGGDAAIIRIPGTDRAVAITVDCNSRYCYLDPRLGAQLSVAECARNLSCVGATPAAITDCLNFGNPENPGTMWQFVEAVEGIAEACRELETPVVSGNVSLYNETDGVGIYPTPTVAMVGIFDPLPPREALVGPGFRGVGDRVVLLGRTFPELDGGEWAHHNGLLGARPPRLSWKAERAVQKLVRELIRQRRVQSAHDLSDGGLAVALVESALLSEGGRLGIDMTIDAIDLAPMVWLFSESASRVLVSVRLDALKLVLDAAATAGVPAMVIGEVTPDVVRWTGRFDLRIERLRQLHEGGLSRFL